MDRRNHAARRARPTAVLALALLIAPQAWAAGGGEAAGAEPSEPAPVPAAEPYWMLEELDWGDDEEVVVESIEFDPYFGCTGDKVNPCALVSAVVDRERLLARFNQHDGKLWQVIFLTPDLAPDSPHLRRVWQHLVDYMKKMKGEPEIAVSFPAPEALQFGAPHLTHFWSLPGLEARVMVGRRDVDRYYVGLFLSDPVVGKIAREPYLARLAAADERLRQRRAADAAKAAKTKKAAGSR